MKPLKVLFFKNNEESTSFDLYSNEKEYNSFNPIGYTKKVEIYQDNTPLNPRQEWDNAGTIISLADWSFSSDKNAYPLKKSVKDRNYEGQYTYDTEDIEAQDVFNSNNSPKHYYIHGQKEKTLVLPIYMYSHSGDTIKNSPFSCKWDSGLVGYIYMSESTAKENGFTKGKNIDWKKVKEYLIGETKTYDQYITGDIYGFIAYDINPINGEIDEINTDSCWGFYGDNEKENGILESISIQNAKEIDSLIFDISEAH